MHSPSLLTTHTTDLNAEEFLALAADSQPVPVKKNNPESRAWRVAASGRRCFVKVVSKELYPERLARDVAICTRVHHLAIVPLWNVIEAADGVMLVFEDLPGEALVQPEGIAGLERFGRLPAVPKLAALSSIFGALAAIVDDGWVLVDFYAGNVLYDFESHRVWIFDFELFQPGHGFTLEMDRNYGSRRLMPPEEFVRGAWIDQRSNVYTLGRFLLLTLEPPAPGSRGEDLETHQVLKAFPALAAVVERATKPDPERRWPTVRAFVEAFEVARG